MASSPGRRGSLGPHFTAQEFACPHCGVALVRDRLVAVLEQLRAIDNKPLHIVSGYRCPVHNEAIGGAANSMHMYGAASDLPAGRVSVSDALRAGATGIGTKGAWVVHIDVRDGPPVRWQY